MKIMEQMILTLKKISILLFYLFIFFCIDQSSDDEKGNATYADDVFTCNTVKECVECTLCGDSEIDCTDEKQNIYRNFNEIPETKNILILFSCVDSTEIRIPPAKNLMNITKLEVIEPIGGAIMFSRDFLETMQNLESLTIGIEWFYKMDLSKITLRLPKLKTLIFTSYSPKYLPFDFYCSFPELEILSLLNVNTDIFDLPCGLNMSCCSHLIAIVIDSSSFNYTGARVDLNAFGNLPNLEIIHIESVSIIYPSNLLVSNFPELTTLRLTVNYTDMYTLIKLRSLGRLRILELNNYDNPSLHFEFHNFSHLRSLYLKNGRIERISSNSFKNCYNLTLLDLSNNKISSLTTRDKSKNVINIFANDGLPRLEYLLLGGNQIKDLDYSMIPESVKVLDVRNNLLSSFSDNEKSCSNHALKELQANCNLLLNLENICFPPFLQLISLTHSKISRLYAEERFSNLDQFALSSNYRSGVSVNIFLEPECTCRRFNKPIRNVTVVPVMNNHRCLYMRACGNIGVEDETSISYCGNLMLTELPLILPKDSHLIYLDGNNLTVVDLDLILQHYPHLEVLYLNNSNVQQIQMTDEPRDIITHIREFHLEDNVIDILPKYFFIKWTKFSSLHLERNSFKQFNILINKTLFLDELHLENNSISEFVVENQFDILYKINTVFLQFNEFSKINSSFCGYKISTLHLENNKITDFDLSCSSGSTLEKLYLQNNHLTVLNDFTFIFLPNLQELNLEGNRIRQIKYHAFYRLHGLKRLNLRRNNIEEMDEEMFSGVYNLEELKFEENSFVEIPPLVFKDLRKLQTLYLNRNKITTLSFDLFKYNEELKELHLEENFIESMDLSLFQNLHSLVSLYLNNNNISEINSHPSLDSLSLQELHLNDNQLKVLNAEEFKGMKKLTKLFLHHNEIHHVDKDTFKDLTSLAILTLHKNKLKQPEIWNFGLSSNIKNLTVNENSFLCECEYINEIRSFFSENSFISNRPEIDCLSTENKEYSIDQFDDFLNQFCRNNKLTIGLSVSIGLLLMIVFISVLLYKYRLAIQVMFYSRFKIRFCYDASMDEGKRYHAFVAYSYDDRAFVAHELVPRLEDYRLCIHDRDFVVGLFIQENIINAVKHSCCTLMIFSKSFVNSEWCKYEFRTAYERTLKDRWRRILVILIEDVNEDDLEDEMQFYLNTTTYLRWGDPLFWEKLYFVLPSPTQSDRERNHRFQQNIPLQELNR